MRPDVDRFIVVAQDGCSTLWVGQASTVARAYVAVEAEDGWDLVVVVQVGRVIGAMDG